MIVNKNNLGALIRRNTAWVLGGQFTHRIYKFFISIILARILFPEDFGLLVTIQIFTGTLGFVAGGGLGTALVQSKNVVERDFHIVFTTQMTICLLIYFIIFFLSPYFALWFDEPRYIFLLEISALSFLLRPFSNITRSRLVRDMRFKEITIIRLISMLFSSLFSIILALNGFGPLALILGGFAGTISGMAMMMFITRWFPHIAFDKSVIQRLGSYGIKVSTNEIIVHIRTQIPNLIISRILGPSSVGLFNKADSLSEMPVNMIAGSTYQTVFRAFSSIQEDLDQSKYIYFRTITLVTIYTLPFYVGLLWIAEPFIVFVYGEKWLPSAVPLQLLTLVGIFRCLTKPSGAVIAAQNKLGKEIKIQLESMVLFIAAALIGIQWDIVGVAAALLPCYLYFTMRMINLANNCINGRYTDLFKALTPALILNTLLFVLLLIVDSALPKTLSSIHPGLYILLLGLAGSIFYTVLFFFLPISALATEKERWKKQLNNVFLYPVKFIGRQ